MSEYPTMSATRGYVLYNGPSRMDGTPIVVIVTVGSDNRKTGPMDQSWILLRDEHPHAAVQQGHDASICGDCRHRVFPRSCYVTTQHGPAGVWRAFTRGLYPLATPRQFDGHFLRIGAYGDPTAVPLQIWRRLLPRLKGWTGYTHFWRLEKNQVYRTFCMASVDTLVEMSEARTRGWRTFRVRHTDSALTYGEIVCPASKEAGHRLTCQQCRICAGQRGLGSTRSVAIYAHGPGKVNFFRNAQEVLQL